MQTLPDQRTSAALPLACLRFLFNNGISKEVIEPSANAQVQICIWMLILLQLLRFCAEPNGLSLRQKTMRSMGWVERRAGVVRSVRSLEEVDKCQ